ncbi:MAG: hypothetical protein U0361_11730 [Nitrospiraceae bacterium]
MRRCSRCFFHVGSFESLGGDCRGGGRGGQGLALTALQPVIEVRNPLGGEYPDRSWERVYHDQYRYDSSFTWCCSPNDTHACRIRAFVRNGMVMQVEQNYDHQTYEDLYGNRGTFAHNPRMCLKGFTFHRRVYGPYRLKGPLMRKGWKEWMDAGSPELTPETKQKYKFLLSGRHAACRRIRRSPISPRA